VNDSTSDIPVGTQIKKTCSAVGIPMNRDRTIMSVRVSRRTRFLRDTRGGAAVEATRSPSGQPLKIDCFCSSMLAQIPSMSSGELKKSCKEGIITVDAKVGSVSRSRYCVMWSD